MSRLSTKERREVALGKEIIGGASIFKCLNVLNVWVRVAEVQEIELSLTFLRHKFLYLVCIGTVFWFFCAVLKINPVTIPIYIHMCTKFGDLPWHRPRASLLLMASKNPQNNHTIVYCVWVVCC